MILTMLLQCYVRQDNQKMTVQIYPERLYALANHAFAKMDKVVVESWLVSLLMGYTMTS